MLELADNVRREVAPRTAQKHKAEFGQFMTPSSVARFMASLFPPSTLETCRLLDAGAGVGALSCAFLDRWKAGGFAFETVEATAYEIDDTLRAHLAQHLAGYSRVKANVIAGDYIELAAAEGLQDRGYTHAILNPPYKKLGGKSTERLALRDARIEAGNFYSAFVALSLLLLEDGGELVAITPRSFCNGPYFRPFRKLILGNAALTHVHVFVSRTHAFRSDAVLQENVIFRLIRKAEQTAVQVSSSTDGTFSDIRTRCIPFSEVVSPDDKEFVIHLVPDDDEAVRNELARYSNTLDDIGLAVATGPVIDFRLKEHLSQEALPQSVPLIYPLHFENGLVVHPKEGARKPNWLAANADTEKWLMPSGHYTLVRRLSSKEERRRIVPAVFDPEQVPCDRIGFENHLNVFHRGKSGIEPEVARGLAVWLGSKMVDDWLRRFSGHTQVNASDLRSLPYPDLNTLGAWGRRVVDVWPSQAEIDRMVSDGPIA